MAICAALCAFALAALSVHAETFYVSKLGDDSDGRSWETAFHTVQAALFALPDAEGGHRVIVRPDTYLEANLTPAHKGAKGAYNELIGDVDNRHGGGRNGRVILDAGDPVRGFKSYDWWGSVRAYKQGWSKEHTAESFSARGWDRWKLRGLYVTGGDGGLMFDLVDETEPFTVIVEDCVSLGRAFGGGVASCLSRDDEPIVFRRCHLWALDWWGDTAAAYVRVENPEMPDRPDIYFEDCTMVSPQCALKAGNFGFDTSMRVAVKNSRLIVLNFSQPQGTPTDGIIQSVEQGKYLHIDLEDTTLMGYKVFGVRVNKETAKDIAYTAKGAVSAYVQYQQEVPEGMLRLQAWPANVFQALVPPAPQCELPGFEQIEALEKDMCEVSAVVWDGRLVEMSCVRPGGATGTEKDYYLRLNDARTGEELARFAYGHGLGCAYAEEGVFYAFASRFADKNWNDVTLFKSSDLKNWESRVVIAQEAEHLFNSSVCKGPDRYVMAYESNDPDYPAFSVKFARSKDLENWSKVDGVVFGRDRYTACPCIRYAGGHYYMMYLERRAPRWWFETYIARSKNLEDWALSRANPVLAPSAIDDGINASDPAIVEHQGKTLVYWAAGDQRTWMNIKKGVYPGGMAAFFKQWYEAPGIVEAGRIKTGGK